MRCISIINVLDTLRLIINSDMWIVDCVISLAGKVYLIDHAAAEPVQSAGAGTIRPGDPHVIAGTVAGRDQRRKPG